ncbi:MAG: gamma-glutamyltransferase family protein [Hyphomicrobiaceae bacterium]
MRATGAMVVAANPLASAAGLEILRAGGSATDAAIAVQMVLNLVEPQSSGLGGGAFLVHYERASGAITSFDGRETAPAAARPDRFLGPDGAPMAFDAAVRSGLSPGVPGVLAMLELAHARFGRLPWRMLFAPAIRLAEDGFAVSPRLNRLLHEEGAQSFDREARAYFFDAGDWPRPVGYRLRNPALAATLRLIAERGARAFYQGEEIAGPIIDRLAAAHPPSDMTRADLAAYQALERPAFCTGYRGHRVCGMGPPSSGGPTIAQVLALIEPFDLGKAPLDPQGVAILAEAEKLAYADRDRYMADPAFVPLPEGLMDAAYIAARRSLIDPARPMSRAEPGMPPMKQGRLFGIDRTIEASGTSQISIVDADGNALAMTTTIESAFGAHIMVAGFLLNNELTDFSFVPADGDGRPVANRVEGGKRPRSSMAPTIVLGPEGELRMVAGSPGGSRIILYVLKAIVCVIDWHCDAGEAAALVNFGSRNGPFEVETGEAGDLLAVAAQARGAAIRRVEMTSGLNIVLRDGGGLLGGTDPRREGMAAGF